MPCQALFVTRSQVRSHLRFIERTKTSLLSSLAFLFWKEGNEPRDREMCGGNGAHTQTHWLGAQASRWPASGITEIMCVMLPKAKVDIYNRQKTFRDNHVQWSCPLQCYFKRECVKSQSTISFHSQALSYSYSTLQTGSMDKWILQVLVSSAPISYPHKLLVPYCFFRTEMLGTSLPFTLRMRSRLFSASG